MDLSRSLVPSLATLMTLTAGYSTGAVTLPLNQMTMDETLRSGRLFPVPMKRYAEIVEVRKAIR
jgi:hypothetical protein